MPDNLPPDTTVVLPPSVRAAAAAADAAHAAAYAPPAGAEPTVVAATVTPEPGAPPPNPPAAAPAAAEPPDPALDATHTPTAEELRESEYARRYNAMKGRYDQTTRTVGTMQEQMAELGDELIRTQNELLRARAGVQPAAPVTPAAPQQRQRAVTDADVQTYGAELIDFVQRAAKDAVAPEVEQVRSQVRQTQQRVTQTATQSLYASLDEGLPEWRSVNTNPRFKVWCGLRDVYSGAVRGRLLNDAFQAADAPRVLSFFQGFLNEEQATGNSVAPAVIEQQPEPAAPREPAIPLTNLAAPGRAKPATGGGSPAGSSADKPVYTRAQVAAFYSAVRRGEYAGRNDEKDRLERAIFAAQNDGRIR